MRGYRWESFWPRVLEVGIDVSMVRVYVVGSSAPREARAGAWAPAHTALHVHVHAHVHVHVDMLYML